MILLFLLTFGDPQVFTETKNGLTELRHEVIVEADRKAVWDLFTTKEGLESWITPVGWVDLRVGGIMETSYNPNAKEGDINNIKVKFEKIKPGWSYTARNIQAPADTEFGPVLEHIPTTLRLEEVAEGKVKVIIMMRGFNETEAHQRVMGFFTEGNKWYLVRLRQRLQEGSLPF